MVRLILVLNPKHATMWTKQKRRSSFPRFILPFLSVGVLAYFSYHVYHGQYGLNTHENVTDHIRSLEARLGELVEERSQWQQQIALIKDGTIEKDMLDEYARRNLNLAKANELIILLPKGE